MRIAAWVFLLCAVVSAAAVFMPNIEIQLGGKSLGKHMSLSLYDISTKRDDVRRFFAVYSAVHGKKKAEAVLGRLANHVGKRVKSHVDDVRDAMETLDEVTDQDVETVAKILTITMWSFLVVSGIMVALMFVETMRATLRRSRVIVALVMAVIAATVAVGIHITYRQVIAEANDELGGHPFALSVGAYVLPLAAIAALAAIVVALVQLQRRVRLGSAATQVAPPPGSAGPRPAARA